MRLLQYRTVHPRILYSQTGVPPSGKPLRPVGNPTDFVSAEKAGVSLSMSRWEAALAQRMNLWVYPDLN